MHEALTHFFETPEQHLFGIDNDGAVFVGMDREAYRRSIFLDRRIAALNPAPTRTPLGPLIEMAQVRPVPSVGWIFHIAHCGSTLLARLIDQPQSGLILREPPPLRQLGVSGARGDTSAAWFDRLGLAHAMAARRFDRSQTTVVKANVPVNFILPELLKREPGATAILLHFALEPYLLAILRSPNHRAWVDRITDQLAPALATIVGLVPPAATAERAAALWLAQMLLFDGNLKANPAARSLDAEALFAQPADVAKAAASHFSIAAAQPDASLQTLLSTYSKSPSKPFDETTRRARQAADKIALQVDIDVARRWVDQSGLAQTLPVRFDRPLFGDAPVLLR
jgi:hypothetical protein